MKWIGFPKSQCTWEPVAHLLNSMELVKGYEEGLKEEERECYDDEGMDLEGVEFVVITDKKGTVIECEEDKGKQEEGEEGEGSWDRDGEEEGREPNKKIKVVEVRELKKRGRKPKNPQGENV